MNLQVTTPTIVLGIMGLLFIGFAAYLYTKHKMNKDKKHGKNKNHK